MIYLFDKNEKLIHVIQKKHVNEAVQEEILNELVTLSLVLPAFYFEKELKVDVGKKISAAYSVGHFDQNKDFQLYKIIRVAEPGHIELLAIHIAYDELQTSSIIKDRRFTNSTAGNALAVSLEGSRWQVGNVEALGEKSYTLYYVPPLEAVSKWRTQYQAEVRFRLTFDGQRITGRYVDGAKQVGRDTGKRFTYGHNALEVVREQDFSEIYTAVIGRGKGEETLGEDGEATGGYGRRIGFEGIDWTSPDGLVHKPFGQDYMELPDRTALYGHTNGKPRFKVQIFDDVENPYELLLDTYDYLLDVSRPRVLFKTTVEKVGDVRLGDRVHIIRKDLDIHYTTRIQKIVRNLLNDRLTTAEVGDYDFFRTDKSKKRTKDTLDSIENEVENVRNATRSRFEQTDERFLLEVERLDGDIVEAYSRIEQTADAIILEVGNQLTALDGKVTQNTSRIEQTASYITSTVDKQIRDLNGVTQTHSSSISQMADSITSIVSFTDVDGNDIATKINQTSTTITLSAQRINMNGITKVNQRLTVGDGWTGNKSIDFYNGGALESFSDATSMQVSTPGDLYLGAAEIRFDRYGSGQTAQSRINFSTAASIDWGTHMPDVTARFG